MDLEEYYTAMPLQISRLESDGNAEWVRCQ
jgi:hypothetical protein